MNTVYALQASSGHFLQFTYRKDSPYILTVNLNDASIWNTEHLAQNAAKIIGEQTGTIFQPIAIER